MDRHRPLLLAVAAASAHALLLPLALSRGVGSSMVLQRDVPTQSLWGTATPGAVVTATLSAAAGNSQQCNATAGSDGIWRAALPPMTATATPMNITFTSVGAAAVSITDVIVGDVVLCSGQSNMQLSLQMGLNATAELAASDAYGSRVRIMYVSSTSAASPAADFAAPAIAWTRASAAAMGAASWAGFSALCWLSGRDLFDALGGGVPIGLIEASVGGTAIRQWVPTAGLARCAQPYNSPAPYGIAPYGHSLLYNGMVAPLTTGPTALKAVLWDQAESDSFPQTPPGYYACQTVSQIAAWRAALRAPALPWLFLHLQPYTGSGPCCLEELRAQQLAALALPAVGYASAIDLGDVDSPWGDVHFRNKQAAATRVVAAALAVAYGGGAAAGSGATAAAAGAYPPPAFLSQTAYFNATSGIAEVDVQFDGAGAAGVALLPAGANITCPVGVAAANCSGFEVLGSDGGVYAATAALRTAGVLTITTVAALPPAVYGVGSAYAWSMWPLVTLYTAAAAAAAVAGQQAAASAALPVLPWRQALTLAGPPSPRPSRIRLHYQASGLCLSTNASAAFPCAGGWANSCPVFLGDCGAPQSIWLEGQNGSGGLGNEALQAAGVGDAGINVDCDACETGRVAKVASTASDRGVEPAFAAGQLQVAGCGSAFDSAANSEAHAASGAVMCLDGGQGTAVPTCEPGEAVAAAQVQLAPCGSGATQGWVREAL